MARQLNLQFKDTNTMDNDSVKTVISAKTAVNEECGSGKKNEEEATYAFGAAMLAIIALIFLG